MSRPSFCRTLVEANTGITTLKDLRAQLGRIRLHNYDTFYCFWGYYKYGQTTKEIYDSLSETEKKNYIFVDDIPYLKENAFRVVPGYEKIAFEDAKDWSLYHPPRETGYPSLDITLDVPPGMTLKVAGKDGLTESKWVPENSIVKFVTGVIRFGTHDCYFLTASRRLRTIDQTTLKARDATEEEIKNDKVSKYYAISYTQIDEGMTVPWTYKNRLGAIAAEYKDNKIPEKSIKTLAPNIFGKIPGLDY